MEELIYEIENAGYRWSMFMTASGTYDMTAWNGKRGFTAHGTTLKEAVAATLEKIIMLDSTQHTVV